jgi:hypothetical protein
LQVVPIEFVVTPEYKSVVSSPVMLMTWLGDSIVMEEHTLQLIDECPQRWKAISVVNSGLV